MDEQHQWIGAVLATYVDPVAHAVDRHLVGFLHASGRDDALELGDQFACRRIGRTVGALACGKGWGTGHQAGQEDGRDAAHGLAHGLLQSGLLPVWGREDAMPYAMCPMWRDAVRARP